MVPKVGAELKIKLLLAEGTRRRVRHIGEVPVHERSCRINEEAPPTVVKSVLNVIYLKFIFIFKVKTQYSKQDCVSVVSGHLNVLAFLYIK